VELEQVVLWALNKNPADRPADADQFIAALEHAKAAIVSGATGQRTSSMAAVAAGSPPGGAVPVPATASEAGPETAPPAAEAAAVDGGGPPPEGPETPSERRRRGRNWLWALVAAVVLAGAGVAAYLLTQPAQAVVPPVVGEQFDVAKTQLLNKGFQVHELSTTSNHPSGYVFAENPTGGAKADKGSTVTLTVSTGPGNTSVPAVEGQPLDAARRAIRQAHLEVGQIQQQSSGQVPNGDVISTSPTAGQTVPINTSVEIFVSSGKPLVKVPDVTGQSQDSAKGALQAAGFQVTTSSRPSSEKSGNVISQDPAGGSEAPSGSTVSLVIATAQTNTTPPPAGVPSVKGQQASAAANALKAAGFNVSQTTKPVTNSSKDGVVLSQNPAGGSSAPKGSTVTIVVGQLQQPGGTTNTTTTP
jgi:serine/threonine-protein kinase